MRTPEFYEKRDICEFLDRLGPDRCWYFKPYTAGFGKSGVPDITGSLFGSFFSIEVKRPGKEPTAIQSRRMSEIAQANGVPFAGTAEVVIQQIKDWLAVRGVVV
jgi:hypothetical protein